MSDILESFLVSQVLPVIITTIGTLLIALLTMGIKRMMSAIGIDNYAVAIHIKQVFIDSVTPVVDKYFHEISKKVKEAADDGKITEEEKQKLLKEAGELAFKEVKELYPEIIGKLHPELKKAEQMVRLEINRIYEQIKKKYGI